MSARRLLVFCYAVALVAADRPETKRFTLQSDRVTCGKALEELARQTSIRVEDVRGEPEQAIRLDLNNVSFWQAVDRLAAAYGARVVLYPSSGRIVLDRRPAGYRPPPVSYDGRFRLHVTRVMAARDVETGNGSTAVSVEVAWDPELLPLYLETRPHNLRLVDDKGKVVAVADEGSSLAPVDGLIAVALDLHLPALPRSVASLRTLEGELSAVTPSKMLTFTFDRLDRLARANPDDPERTLTQENVTCRVLKVTLDRDRWTVQLALNYPPGMKQLDTNQSWVVNNEMVLESPDGKKRLAGGGYVLESATSRRAVLSYHFRGRGKPGDWRARYRTPANLVEVPIKFSFRDVPLP